MVFCKLLIVNAFSDGFFLPARASRGGKECQPIQVEGLGAGGSGQISQKELKTTRQGDGAERHSSAPRARVPDMRPQLVDARRDARQFQLDPSVASARA